MAVNAGELIAVVHLRYKLQSVGGHISTPTTENTDLGSMLASKMSFYKCMFSFHQDPRGCLASPVFQGKEESLALRDALAGRGTRERMVGLASSETRG